MYCLSLENLFYFIISAPEIDKPPPAEKNVKKLPETHVKNLADVDSKVSTLAIAAVAAYDDAANAVRG
jgi:hypothetical protein